QVSSDPAFVELFGQDARSLAIYHHQHDHSHDLHGSVVTGKPHVHGPNCKH
ncbi:MAG: zinc ABC transporter ATP-binding protein, partial [Gammaproteobacteria bacterium HGW-Gammaproteobacteria-9]